MTTYLALTNAIAALEERHRHFQELACDPMLPQQQILESSGMVFEAMGVLRHLRDHQPLPFEEWYSKFSTHFTRHQARHIYDSLVPPAP